MDYKLRAISYELILLLVTAFPGPTLLTRSGQVQLALPSGDECFAQDEMLRLFQEGIDFGQCEGVVSGIVEDAGIADDAGDAKIRQAGLTCSQEIAGASYGEVFFRQHETVGRFFHDF